jgi:DNA processing protein
MTPTRMRALVEHFGSVLQAFTAVADGRAAEAALSPERGTSVVCGPMELAREWRAAIGSDLWATRIARRGTVVWVDGAPGYPIHDPLPDRPGVLLAEGSRPEAMAARRVGIVGTRAASPHGLEDAHDLGAYLGAAGITVVSGMAIGIDGAAHEGVIDAGGLAVGVVATGLDVEYPRRHRALYQKVRASGVVVSETAFGVQPDRWRFPVRNRIIAALSDVVVVVEATLKGGARITAQFALEYGRTVLAMPGSRRNRAARGTNELIADGAQPLLEWSDVLVALGLTDGSAPALKAPPRPAPGPDGAALLRALGGDAATPDQLASRAGLAPERLAVALFELERAGWVDRAQGAIWPR